MKKITPCIFAFLSLFIVACGKPDEPAIVVDESKVAKPTDESGDVEYVKRTFNVKIAAPSPAWSVKISEIWVVGSEIWVLSDLTQKEGMAAQVITEISDSVTTDAPDIEAIYYLIGKTGGWKPEDSATMKLIYSKDEIATGLKEGFPIWPKQ